MYTKNSGIRWMTLEPDAELKLNQLSGDIAMVILKGTVSQMPQGEYISMQENDCVYFKKEDKIALTAGNEGAEILELTWSASENTSELSISPGTVFNKPELQFCQPAKELDARIIQGRKGQLCFVRMKTGAEFTSKANTEENIMVIERGWLDKKINGKTVRMEKGDIVYLDKSTIHNTAVGPEGCDVIMVFTPSCRDYTDALESRLQKYHTIIPPGERPQLLFDGTSQKPGLVAAEGPSWLNNKLYFSNYYTFIKEEVTREEGGLRILNPDGSCEVANKDVQTCGTTPLPNGNIAACDLLDKTVLEITPDGEVVRTIADSYRGMRFEGNPNDIITDRKGGIYFTNNLGNAKDKNTNAVMYIKPDGEVIKVTDWHVLGFPNGLVLSADDKTLYLNDSRNTTVWMFDVNDDGSLSNMRPFCELKLSDHSIGRGRTSTGSDGITIDRSGNLYITSSNGVQIFDKTGELLGIILFPSSARHCVFGGDDYSTLYVILLKHVYSIKTNMTGFQYPLR
ncbi:SMP-30/gluconolactonase/LRE family protein [Candidatus Latescibacterota bacterium]